MTLTGRPPRGPSGLWLSKRWMGKLSKSLQATIMKTAKDMEVWAGHMAAGYNARAEALWKKNGAEVIRLSADVAAEFDAASSALAAEVIAELEADGINAKEWADALQ